MLCCSCVVLRNDYCNVTFHCLVNLFVYYLALIIDTYTIPAILMSLQNSYFCCLPFLRLFVKKEHSWLTLLWHGDINRWFSRVPPIFRHNEQILVSAWTVDFIAAVQLYPFHLWFCTNLVTALLQARGYFLSSLLYLWKVVTRSFKLQESVLKCATIIEANVCWQECKNL